MAAVLSRVVIQRFDRGGHRHYDSRRVTIERKFLASAPKVARSIPCPQSATGWTTCVDRTIRMGRRGGVARRPSR